MSQNVGSANKKWRGGQSHFRPSNRRPHSQRPFSHGYNNQRSSRGASSYDNWRRSEFHGYENNFGAESAAIEGGGGAATPGVGIFITPYYPDFGSDPSSWKSNRGYTSFQNNKLDEAGEMSERWRSSSRRNGSSSGSRSSVGGKPNDRRVQNANLLNVPYSFDVRGDRSRPCYSSKRPTDQRHVRESANSEVSSSIESDKFKAIVNSSASKLAGRETTGQDQGPETGNHSVPRCKDESVHRSNSKSSSKMQNKEHLNVVMPSEKSKAGFDKTSIPSLADLVNHKILPKNTGKNGKITSKNGSKSPRKKQLSKVLPSIRQRTESSLSGKSQTVLQDGEVLSSSGTWDSSDTQVSERTKRKNSSAASGSCTAPESLQSSESDFRSANAGVRPKVDIVLRKKRSSGLSKEDLMKLISSPRSRQEHLQLNRILQAHAEKQKTTMQHAETEDHEDVEPSGDHSGFFKEIEVSALPVEIQREIDILCQSATDVDHSELSDVSIINLSLDESLSVSRYSPAKDTASNANASSLDNALQNPQVASACRVSATVFQSQGCSSDVQSRVLSSGCPVTVEQTPNTLGITSVSHISCQPNVSHSLLGSTGEKRSCDNQSALSVADSSITTAVDCGITLCNTGLAQRSTPPASTDCRNIINECRNDQGGLQPLGSLLQISLREEEIRCRLKETEIVVTDLQEQLKHLNEQLAINLSLKHELNEEKVRLRSLRLQILKESVSHQQEDSTVAVTPIVERLADVPYESIIEVTPSQNTSPADNGYGSILRNGVMNIEPVNDDFEAGLGFGETVCPAYEDREAMHQLITIAPLEGGEFSDEDERMQGNSSCEHSVAAVSRQASERVTEPSVGLQHHSNAHQVLPVPEELDSNRVSVHMEYVGTLSTSNLQPEVLQQIALSLQPLDAQNAPFHSSCVTSSTVHEFSCSEDEAAEPRGPANGTLGQSGTNKRTLEPDSANKRNKTKGICKSVVNGLEDCVISRVERPISRKPRRGLKESEPATVAAGTVSGKVPSQRRSASGDGLKAIARAQKLASTSNAIPNTNAVASSDNVCNVTETPRTVPRTIRSSPAPQHTTTRRLPDTVLTGDSPMLSFEQLCDYGRIAATAPKETCVRNDYRDPSTKDPIRQKRKSASVTKEPPAKRKKSLEKPNQKKTPKAKRMTITSIYPRVCPGVLYRHAESARSIVLDDEVVITASDDGQIVRHPLPRQVYGLVEKQTFTGHQGGVVGLIASKVQVSRGICRTVALSIGRDQLLKMHCIQTGKVLMTHKFDKGVCYDCICEVNDTVYVGLDDGSIARITTSNFAIKEPFALLGSSRISALASFVDGLRPLLLIGFGDCTISVRDASNNLFMQTLHGHVRAPRFIVTLSDRIASSSGDCSVFIHCLKRCNTLVTTLHLPSPVVAMTVQARHELLVVACRNRSVTFIDIKDNLRYITRLSTIEFPLTCIAASHHMVYFGCSNGLVHHIDVDMTRHWSCGFVGCKDWFLLKGDLEDHITEEHCGSNQPVLLNGHYHHVCGWLGCQQIISNKRKGHKARAHFLGHIANLDVERTSRSSAITN